MGGNHPVYPPRLYNPLRGALRGYAPPEYPDTIEAYFRQIYYEALDLLINGIKDRFNQTDFHIYKNCEQLLLKAANKLDYSHELAAVTDFYKTDFHLSNLRSNLEVLSANISNNGMPLKLKDIIAYMKQPRKGLLLNEVSMLLHLVLVMPATNATSERCFSALRRLKTYLRATMTQQRLNSTMLLYIHKDITDNLDLVNIANDFTFQSQHRRNILGTFTVTDLTSRPTCVSSVGIQTREPSTKI